MPDPRQLRATASCIRDTARRRLFAAERALVHFGQGDHASALALIDLCCNERVPAAEDLLLRAEILGRSGFQAASSEDGMLAFEIDPSLPAIQLKRLETASASLDDEGAKAVVLALLRQDLRDDVMRRCAEILLSQDNSRAVGACRMDGASLELQIFARSDVPIELTFHFDKASQQIFVSPREPSDIGGMPVWQGRASVAWPRGARILTIAHPPDLVLGRTSFARSLTSSSPSAGTTASGDEEVRPSVSGSVSIIVPIFAGVEETIFTLVSVMKHTNLESARLILVDDRGPDRALVEVLAAFENHPAVTVLRNPTNLGFIGSINRGLAAAPIGDVVLLNADTQVGPGWLERLTRAARSPGKIGTVTPLSNNGELTSVPRPFESSAMPDAAEIEAINTALETSRQGETIEIPNGVGFCLYVTDAFRREVGFLDERDYVEGYLEEVDYCLRGSAKGFVHLCALDTFVAHKGGTSFKDRRRSLVVRNLRRLERKFPQIRQMTHRFMQAGLLEEVAQDVQRAVLTDAALMPIAVDLEIGSDLSRLRLHGNGAEEVPVLSLTMEGEDDSLVRLRSSALFSPADFCETLPRGDEVEIVRKLLGRFMVKRVAVDLSEMPGWVRDLVMALGAPVELAVTRSIRQRSFIDGLIEDCELRQLPIVVRAGSRRSVEELTQFHVGSPGFRGQVSKIGQDPPSTPSSNSSAIAIFVEEPGRWSDRQIEVLASGFLRYPDPPDLIVLGEPGPPHRAERLGIVRRLVQPSLDSIAEALRARGAVLCFHLSDPDHAVTRWADEMVASNLPVVSTSSYVATSGRYSRADHVTVEEAPERLVTHLKALMTHT